MNLRTKFFTKRGKSNYVHYEDEEGPQKLAMLLQRLAQPLPSQDIVIVFIGTDRSTGDSLGPLSGSLLLDKAPEVLHVYGTLGDPVHAVNLEERLTQIHETHHKPFVVAVDACLGKIQSVGFAAVGEGALKPGAGVQKQLPEVGDVHINGIVNVSGFMEFFVLQNTRLHTVMSLAQLISAGMAMWDQWLLEQAPSENNSKLLRESMKAAYRVSSAATLESSQAKDPYQAP
ncbi:spore protease YyaC [Aureibacillus halotolerans]|uniref:Putative sporulation protein YyaC n=1 Tax=Aureibacillus halotolerans TaxID=1508390 RepID=A0A4R6TZN4_9BACI|nr:spore protease YyaC [Aureibacillus halotolerans]TDQ38352.1 putative sporulation protein YyaC [Aureibacillus halotolerans]